jgi:NADH-quinone oxidoreductase subunit I
MAHSIQSGLRALTTTIVNVFRRTDTVQFPQVIRPRAERFRASFALLHDEQGDELCIGCLFCERICPSAVISIKQAAKRESPVTGKKRGYADDFTLDMSACIFCELCVQVCPTDAIVMTREQDQPAFGREDLVLTMAKLYANEKSKTRSWGDGTRLMGMQDGPKPPKVHEGAKGHAAAPATTTSPATTASPATAASPASAAEQTPVAAKPGATAPAPADAHAPSATPSEAPAAKPQSHASPQLEFGNTAPPAPTDGGAP